MARTSWLWIAAILVVALMARGSAGRAAEPGPRTLAMYRLKHADARTLAEAIGDLLKTSRDIRLTADSRQNGLLVMASEEDHKTLRKLMELVDRPGEPAAARTSPKAAAPVPGDKKIDAGKAGDAELRNEVAALSQRVVNLTGRVQALEELTRLRILPVRSARGAPPEQAPAPREIKVFSLQHADGVSLVEAVAEILPGVEQKTLRLACDKRTNSVLASGPKEDLAVLEALLLRLDVEAAKDRKPGPSPAPKPTGKGPS